MDHKFNDQWSMHLTTDFQYSSAISSTEVYLKKAYAQYKPVSYTHLDVYKRQGQQAQAEGGRHAHSKGQGTVHAGLVRSVISDADMK